MENPERQGQIAEFPPGTTPENTKPWTQSLEGAKPCPETILTSLLAFCPCFVVICVQFEANV